MKAYLNKLDIQVNYINHESSPEEFTKRLIKSVPRTIFVKDGIEVKHIDGFIPEAKLKEVFEAL